MKRTLLIIVGLLCLASFSLAADRFTVKYLSAENVYLDGGEADGLSVGARLVVIGTGGVKSELEVVFVAAHSASCKVVGAPGDIRIGDRVQLKSLPAGDTAIIVDTAPAVTVDTAAAPSTVVRPPTHIPAPLTGSVSVNFYQWNDESASNLDFTQATARVSLKARRLWGKEMTLAVRGRGRFDKRQRDYRSEVEREDWQNRLWEFSLSYEEPTAPINFWAGRILPRRAGGIGYLDGVLIEGVMSGRMRAGLFAGTYPNWLYDERSLSLMKGGGYVAYTTGDYRGLFVEECIGAVGEYHGSEANREYLTVQGRLSRGNAWGVNHAAEIDVNRSWRKDRAGKTFEMSSLYVTGWVRPVQRLRLSLSYDNRTNYWTFVNRSTVDSLFDDNLRQGARLQADLTLPSQVFASVSTGYRDRAGDPDPSWSYAAQLRKGDAFIKGLSLSAQYAAFDNSSNHGYNYSVRAGKLIGGRHSLSAAYGSYAYRTDDMAKHRDNDWVELSGQADVGRHYWLGLGFQTDSGDDIKGYRIRSELGYRF
jgi:hypothetical protein